MRIEVTEVTPELARHWLGNNPANRSVRRKIVESYARDMANGNWRKTGDAIRLTEDGRLLDGQHRLLALIDAGVTLEFVVITGDDLDQEQMDTGAQRTLGDVLRMRGEANYKILSTVLRAICQWEDVDSRFSNRTPTRSETMAALERYPWVREGCAKMQRAQQEAGLPTPVGAICWFWFWQIDAEDCEHFFNRLIEGSGEVGDPIFMLHRWLSREENVELVPKRVVTAVVVKAWNFYRSGETVQNLRFRAGGANPESFPTPI